jgi:hypothetical protein
MIVPLSLSQLPIVHVALSDYELIDYYSFIGKQSNLT